MSNPLEEIGLDDYPLPNGKALVRLDFKKDEV